MDTIRERIIQSIAAKLADIRVANGYETDIGAHVYRAAMTVPKQDLPAISLIPGVEESAKRYGCQVSTMPVRVLALAEHGDTNPSVLLERMLGDMITCILGVEYVLAFSDGSYEPSAGDIITGRDSLASATVLEVSIVSGSWATGDATGTLRLRGQAGHFQADELLDIVGHAGCASASSDSVETPAYANAGGGLVDEIAYAGGGTDDYPESIDITTTATAVFSVRYRVAAGNPYEQPS